MDKAQQILFHLDELYAEEAKEEKILRACEINPAKYGAWRDAFDEYDLSDVLFAIDEFWQYKSNKTRPNVAQIRAILNAKKAEKIKKAEATAPVKELPSPENLMAQDVAAGCCRNNLYVYREAFDICLNQFLPEVVPADVAEHAFYPRNVQLAVENGVFGRFDEAMIMAAQRRFGRDYEFPSANDLEAMKQAGDSRFRKNDSVKDVADILASHWRVA